MLGNLPGQLQRQLTRITQLQAAANRRPHLDPTKVEQQATGNWATRTRMQETKVPRRCLEAQLTRGPHPHPRRSNRNAGTARNQLKGKALRSPTQLSLKEHQRRQGIQGVDPQPDTPLTLGQQRAELGARVDNGPLKTSQQSSSSETKRAPQPIPAQQVQRKLTAHTTGNKHERRASRHTEAAHPPHFMPKGKMPLQPEAPTLLPLDLEILRRQDPGKEARALAWQTRQLRF